MIVAGYFWAWLIVWTMTGAEVGHQLGPRFDTYADCAMMRELVMPQAKSEDFILEVCRPVPNPKTWAPLTAEIPDWRTWGKSWREVDSSNTPVPTAPPAAWTLWLTSPHQVALAIIWPPDPTDPPYPSKAACERAGAGLLSSATKAGRAASFECLPFGIAPRYWYRQ